MHVPQQARRVMATTLSIVRRGRPVLWTPDWMRLGNLLYLGEWCYSHDPEARILLHPAHADALSMFPRLKRDFFISRDDVKPTDRRVMPWSGQEDVPARDHFDPPHLDSYIKDVLLPGSLVLNAPEDLTEALVLNVRRGDYYSNPDVQAEFGMDIVAFLEPAIRASLEHAPSVNRVVVISDDIQWCRDHLSAFERGLGRPWQFEDGDIVHDMSYLVHAQHLIIPNSTFSYWGGYIGDALYPRRHVIAPWLFSRARNGGRAYQLRPEWTVIDLGAGWTRTEPPVHE